jgi:hypothetical protein
MPRLSNLTPPARTRLRTMLPSRNLLRRPAKPALGRGRVQTMVRRALTLQPVLSTSELKAFVYVRRQYRDGHVDRGLCLSIRRAAESICERVGRAETNGRPWKWRLRSTGPQPVIRDNKTASKSETNKGVRDGVRCEGNVGATGPQERGDPSMKSDIQPESGRNVPDTGQINLA